MKVNYPGLIKEKLPSGNYRFRVRVEGKPTRRVTLHIGPDHKDFSEHYKAARRGIEIPPEAKPIDTKIKGSLGWLISSYTEWLEDQVGKGLYSQATLVQRRSKFKLLKPYEEYSLAMPQDQLLQIRDDMADTPGSADNFIKAVRSLYAWAIERNHAQVNPAIGVGKINKGKGGAKPWTVADLKKYREHHEPGTMAHLCLTLFMFTACRISDAILLGRSNEFERNGIKGLGWQPTKKGSAYVEIPMLPPLLTATRSMKIQGPTYLLTEYGKPFQSPEGLRNRFRKWCDNAGLHHLSSHGIRKATGNLLAQEGASQYQIMSIHGHTQAKTSEVYTKGVERWRLAADAMNSLSNMDW
ncbi:tyrosine-type recombinase/integrase [Roseibium sediminis]|uniref:tyrosine-type recombinase/integrase n=1 Tax=Roseibium sediminis TaxID=1775174 RepID=UPI00123D0DD3|nr:tyrosine-type recombinase/integrase [Roseibium sediminis]